MSPLPEFWWRIEVDEAGAIINCVQVEAEKRGSARVVYIRGKSPTDARKNAAEWHARHRRYQSVSQKRLAAKRNAAGKCKCCDRAICPESTVLCKEHLEKRREYNRRHRNGEATPRVRADSVELHSRHLADHRIRTRMTEQLPELLRIYDELDGVNTGFRQWLMREIAVREVGTLRLVKSA